MPAGRAVLAAGVAWLVLFGLLDYLVPGVIAISLFCVAPLIAATVLDERRTAVFAAGAVALAIGSGWRHGIAADVNYWTRVGAVGVVSVMAVVVAGVRRKREERLAQMTAIAEATQLALLPPLARQMAGVNIAARYRSATLEAAVGGDLYEIVPTRRGLRAIIGDVRGKGLDAVRLAGLVLSAFRRGAVTLLTLEQVAGEIGRTIEPHMAEEEFVTAALVEVSPAGTLTIVNCGHLPPLLRDCDGTRPLASGATALPFGIGGHDLTAFTATWSRGNRLLLYTDGLVESRDKDGNFLPAEAIDAALLAPDCEQALDVLVEAVRRHTGGRARDDMALLLLERGTAPDA